jgi:hypothetical protein
MVAAVPQADGEIKGAKCKEPFDYTGCKVVGGRSWNSSCKSLFVAKMGSKCFGKSGIWKNGGDATWENNPFKRRFCHPGEDWEAELRKSMRTAKIVWVNDLISWSVEEGNRMFAGSIHSGDWVIYHDALSQWWDPAAQGLLKRLKMADSQVKARGPTAAQTLTTTGANGKAIEMLNKNRHKLMGDTP